MISDDSALVICEKLPWHWKKAGHEFFTGTAYDEPATIQYKPIRHIDSTKTNWQELVVNKDEHPGLITFKGYKAEHIHGGDFLIYVFERFDKTVQERTEEMKGTGEKWSEARLLKMLYDISGAGVLLSDKRITHGRITPKYLLIAAQDLAIKLPLAKSRPRKRLNPDPFLAPELSNQAVQISSLTDVYSLGASLMYMCMGGVPDEVKDGTKTWLDFIEKIALDYVVLAQILPKLLDRTPTDRYDFRHLKSVIGIGDMYSLLRLNSLIAQDHIRDRAKEVRVLLESLGGTLKYVTIERVKSVSATLCPSCMEETRDIGPVGFICMYCGAINYSSVELR
jgi:serine/threonine protein kinase